MIINSSAVFQKLERNWLLPSTCLHHLSWALRPNLERCVFWWWHRGAPPTVQPISWFEPARSLFNTVSTAAVGTARRMRPIGAIPPGELSTRVSLSNPHNLHIFRSNSLGLHFRLHFPNGRPLATLMIHCPPMGNGLISSFGFEQWNWQWPAPIQDPDGLMTSQGLTWLADRPPPASRDTAPTHSQPALICIRARVKQSESAHFGINKSNKWTSETDWLKNPRYIYLFISG